MNDLFLGTQIEKMNKLFHGKMDYSVYGKPMRFKLEDGVVITKDDLIQMYEEIEETNEKFEFSAVVFYTNIKPTKCPICEKRELKRKDRNVYECANCRNEIEIMESASWKITITNEKYKNILVTDEEKKEKWDDILVYEKKFAPEEDKEDLKYFKFNEIAGKYSKISRERFPERPSELDVKNLLYVWVSDFVSTEGKIDENKGNKSKRKWEDEIKEKIGEVWIGNENKDKKIKEFGRRFIDLDEVKSKGD